MSTTPLWTSAELDTQIAAYKQALLALATAAEYELDIGGSRRRIKRTDIPSIRSTLQYLQDERVKLDVGSGPQSIVGRVFRG